MNKCAYSIKGYLLSMENGGSRNESAQNSERDDEITTLRCDGVVEYFGREQA